MRYLFLNWKAYLGERQATTLAGIVARAKKRRDLEVAVFPSALHLLVVHRTVRGLELGVQNVAPGSDGAWTGEVLADEAKKLGAKYALIGHSERRALGESDALIAAKIHAAIAAGLVPILCVGENREERKAGKTRAVLERQLKGAFAVGVPKKLFVAYEPMWAIGASKPAEEPDIAAAALIIREILIVAEASVKTPVLYGGSVDHASAEALLRVPGIDGLLVGRAGADPKGLEQLLDVVTEMWMPRDGG